MAESSPNRYKTLCEKGKLLVMNNFSSSHSVSKDLFCRHIKIRDKVFDKGLKIGIMQYSLLSALYFQSQVFMTQVLIP